MYFLDFVRYEDNYVPEIVKKPVSQYNIDNLFVTSIEMIPTEHRKFTISELMGEYYDCIYDIDLNFEEIVDIQVYGQHTTSEAIDYTIEDYTISIKMTTNKEYDLTNPVRINILYKKLI